MSARDEIEFRLGVQDCPDDMKCDGCREARGLADRYRAEVTAKVLHGAVEAAEVIHQRCHRDPGVCAGCQVRADILDVLRSVADVIGKSNESTADVTVGGEAG
jgi:hypothetical protein